MASEGTSATTCQILHFLLFASFFSCFRGVGFPTVWYGNGSGNGGPACEEYSACSASGEVDALPWLFCWKAWKPGRVWYRHHTACMRVSRHFLALCRWPGPVGIGPSFQAAGRGRWEVRFWFVPCCMAGWMAWNHGTGRLGRDSSSGRGRVSARCLAPVTCQGGRRRGRFAMHCETSLPKRREGCHFWPRKVDDHFAHDVTSHRSRPSAVLLKTPRDISHA